MPDGMERLSNKKWFTITRKKQTVYNNKTMYFLSIHSLFQK